MKYAIDLDVLLPSGEHKHTATIPLDTETWGDMALRILLKFVPKEEIKEGSYEIYTMHGVGDGIDARRYKIYANELISALKSIVHIDFVNPFAIDKVVPIKYFNPFAPERVDPKNYFDPFAGFYTPKNEEIPPAVPMIQK